jgi:thiol:disulfide interchange protein DsbD
MGLTVGLVAAPCVGPFVIGLLAYVGATGNPWQGFWMFLSLSLGLGAPYLALAVFAGSIARLPRAGEWMEGVKHVFGLALLGMAVYFAAPLLPRAAEPWALPGYLLAAALYLLIFERAASQVRGFRAFRLACAAAALAGALAIGWPAPPGIAWEAFSTEAVADARTSGLPVIIDFTADWCLPCKELDRITFRDARVVEAAREFVALKADVSEFTAPPIEALRRQYEIFGVPTVLFLDAQGREPRHLRVNGYLSPEEFHARMLEAAGSARPRAAQAEPPAGR